MSEEMSSLRELALSDPLGERDTDSQNKGVTMIIDKGLGVRYFEDILETSGFYINFIKLGFGTAALYPPHVMQKKILLAREYHVDVYPGGTFFEVAYHLGKVPDYLTTMKQLGFTKIEISDGTVDLPLATRREIIAQTKELGLDVITEYGKKLAGSHIDKDQLLETVTSDLQAGAHFVIVEGRESGENVGIYDQNGKIQEAFSDIVNCISPYKDQIIWEAPKKNQQVELMDWFGPNVNLGNIAPDDIFSVESLRRGLRSDTFFLAGRREQA